MAPVLSAGVTTSSRVFLSLLLGWEGETTPRLAGVLRDSEYQSITFLQIILVL